MTRGVFYFLLGLIACAALIIAFVSFRFFKPYSLMLFYSKEYGKAIERYQELYDSNDRSISVIGPLVQLNLQYANVDEALRLME